MSPTSAELAVLRSALDRLIPPDDFAGAVEAGCEAYITRLLDTDLREDRFAFLQGLQHLDAEARAACGTGWLDLSSPQQDALLSQLERGKVASEGWSSTAAKWFFERLLNFAAEGYYADPGNGGNRDAVSWKMLGYDPRRPNTITAP
jgi:hypothetical protein